MTGVRQLGGRPARAARSGHLGRRPLFAAAASLLIAGRTRAAAANSRPTVGILWHAANPEGEGAFYTAMLAGFSDLGYADGSNINLVHRFPGQQAAAYHAHAQELAALKVDAIVAVSTPSALAAQKATSTIPIVILPIVDPVRLKLVPNLARPGGNITGFSSMGVDVAAKRVQLLKDAVPRTSRIALLFDPVVPYNIVGEISDSKRAAEQIGITLEEFQANQPEDIEPTLAKIAQGKFDSLIVCQGPMFYLQRQRINEAAVARGLASMGYSEVFAESGGLLSYGPNMPGIYRAAPSYVDRILKGANAGDLPVQQPTRFELIVNLRTARALAIEPPHHVLARAERIIE